jgi:hypothetical protein
VVQTVGDPQTAQSLMYDREFVELQNFVFCSVLFDIRLLKNTWKLLQFSNVIFQVKYTVVTKGIY